MKSKKAQQTMGLPFSLIFSIILIIIFFVVAFFVIQHFLDFNNCSSLGLFYDDLQNNIDEAWQSQSSDFEITPALPSNIKKICLANLSATITNTEDYEEIKFLDVYEANLFVIPTENTCNMPYKNLKHLNIIEITKTSNPLCFTSDEKITIKKDFYDRNVVIK